VRFVDSPDTLRVQLAVQDGQRLAKPIGAAILILSDSLRHNSFAYYADSETPCLLLGRVGADGEVLRFANTHDTLRVAVEPAAKVVRVVYTEEEGASVVRETALVLPH
jgi:hypothetical protein